MLRDTPAARIPLPGYAPETPQRQDFCSAERPHPFAGAMPPKLCRAGSGPVAFAALAGVAAAAARPSNSDSKSVTTGPPGQAATAAARQHYKDSDSDSLAGEPESATRASHKMPPGQGQPPAAAANCHRHPARASTVTVMV